MVAWIVLAQMIAVGELEVGCISSKDSYCVLARMIAMVVLARMIAMVVLARMIGRVY